MRKIAAYYEQVVLVKIRFKGIGNPFTGLVALASYNNGDYFKRFLHMVLKERNLHFEAMLIKISIVHIAENRVCFYQFISQPGIHRHFSQGGQVITLIID